MFHSVIRNAIVATTLLVLATFSVAAFGAGSGTAGAGGFQHTLIVEPDGDVVATGRSDYGEVGPNQAQGFTSVPVHVGVKAKVVAAGQGNSAAIRLKDGSIAFWGRTGVGYMPYQFRPEIRTIGFFSGSRDIALTWSTLYIVAADGSVWSWNFVRDPLGQEIALVNIPVPVVEIAASINSTGAIGSTAYNTVGGSVLARDESGNVWVFGMNDKGQLGLGHFTFVSNPTLNPALVGAKSVAVSDNAGLVALNDGTVLGFGQNYYGSLGRGAATPNGNYPTPAPVQGFVDVKAVSATRNASFAVTNAGQLLATGWHNLIYVGNCDYMFVQYTCTVNTPQIVKTFVAGSFQQFLIRGTDGTTKAWGAHRGTSVGMLGTGETVAEYHTLVQPLDALRADTAEVIPVPAPAPLPVVEPAPVVQPAPLPEPVVEPAPVVVADPAPVVQPAPEPVVVEPAPVVQPPPVVVTPPVVVQPPPVVVTPPAPTPVQTCKPGYGYGDKNHCHAGPPGQLKKTDPTVSVNKGVIVMNISIAPVPTKTTGKK